MAFESYTTTDPNYKGRDAVTFFESSKNRFCPIYHHESVPWQFQTKDIVRTSILGFFYINMKFDTDFTSRIIDELNKRGKGQIKQILGEIFGPPTEPD